MMSEGLAERADSTARDAAGAGPLTEATADTIADTGGDTGRDIGFVAAREALSYRARIAARGPEDGLLDRRAVLYRLTPAGERTVALANRTGGDSKGAETDAAARKDAIRANREAVLRQEFVIRQEARRAGDYDADTSCAEMEDIAYEASLIGAVDLVVDALGEAATMLRQRHRPDEARALVEARFDEPAFATPRGIVRRNYELAKLEMLAERPRLDVVDTYLAACRPHLSAELATAAVWVDLTTSERHRLDGDVVEAYRAAASAIEWARRAQPENEQTFPFLKAGIQAILVGRTADVRTGNAQLADQVRTWAIRYGYKFVAAEAGFHLGELLRYGGDHDEALAFLNTAAESFVNRSGEDDPSRASEMTTAPPAESNEDAPWGLADRDTVSAGAGRAATFALSALGACMFDQATESGNSGRPGRRPQGTSIDLAQKVGTSRKTLGRAHIQLTEALEAGLGSNAADATALTRRRLGIVEAVRGGAGSDDRAAEHFEGAFEIYKTSNRRSTIGRLEAKTGLACLTRKPDDIERAIALLGEARARVEQVVGAPEMMMSLIDPWVFNDLRDVARGVSPALTDVVESELASMRGAGVVRKTHVRGHSAMGREPVLL